MHDFFQQTFKSMSPKLRHYLRGYLDDVRDIEDIIQDTFIKFWNKLATGSTFDHPEASLYVIAKNTAFDHCRKYKRRSCLVVSEPLNISGDQLDCGEAPWPYLPADRYEEHELEVDFATLEQVLSQLNASQREALLLHAEGYSYTEIAAKQQTSLGTIRSRIHHARKRANESLIACASGSTRGAGFFCHALY